MRNKMLTFMMGRNGMDALSNALSWTAIIVMGISFFLPKQELRQAVSLIALAVLIYAYSRILSRDIAKRRQENAAFLRFFSQGKLRFQQRKTHKFYRCPQCKATLRVPKGRGKIQITCTCCGNQFIKRT